ncbi:unnamed protein product [Sphagnum jensenii]|uniref:PDZ domain-containing protein n=1 Tax=Sphagnum jensenii TaxID=128206 RepID=A0ABP1AHC4_9BRYO
MALAVMDVMYHTAIAVLPSSSSSSFSSVKANVQQQMWQQQLHPWSAAAGGGGGGGGGAAAAAAGGGWQVLVQMRKDVKKLVTEFLGNEGMHMLCLQREEAIVKRGGRGRLGGGRVGSTDGFAPVTMSSSSSKGAGANEVYEVELEKPFGIKFYKGSDGGPYIDAIAPGGSADKTKMLTPGDRVIATSAVFGNEMWPAAEYGRTMYTVRQRIGTLAMKMEKRYGVREDRGVSAEVLSAERNAGSIGEGIREIQVQNYLRKMELKKQREEELTEGLKLYNAAKYEAALEKFETVLGLKPAAREEAVASYNVACCYSQLKQIDAALSALEQALEAGFDDYTTVRQDPDLGNVRASPGFLSLVNKYDEPFINENAVNALKSVFGLFGRK